MRKKIISSRGFQLNGYYIPPFELYERELLGIYLENKSDSHIIYDKIVKLFCFESEYPIEINKTLDYAKHFRQNIFRQKFKPVTVGEYLNKNANPKSNLFNTIYEIDYINPKTRIETLPGNPRRLLTLSALISKSTNIIFDTIAQDSEGIKTTLDFVHENVVNQNGSAIWFSFFKDSMKTCTRHIEIEKIKN